MPPKNGTPSLSCDIESILQRREDALSIVGQIEALLGRLQLMAGDGIPKLDAYFAAHGRCSRDSFNRANASARIEREVWSHLIHATGMWTFMDHKARTEWRQTYDRGDFPEMTRENIESAFRVLYESRKSMVARGVSTLFDKLSSEHKTNSARAFGMKLIVQWVVTSCGNNPKTYRIDLGRAELFDDLDRFLHLMRDLPEPEHRTNSAYRTLSTSIDNGTWVAKFRFFSVRLYKKGTAHITFDHAVDVDRLNVCLSVVTGGNRIPKSEQAS